MGTKHRTARHGRRRRRCRVGCVLGPGLGPGRRRGLHWRCNPVTE